MSSKVVLHQSDDEVVAFGPILNPDNTYYAPVADDTTTMVIKANHHVTDGTGTPYDGELVEDDGNAGQWWAVFTVPKGDLPTLSKKFARVRIIDSVGNQQTIYGGDVEVDPGRQAQRATATTAPVLNLAAGAAAIAALTAEVATKETPAGAQAKADAAVAALLDGAPGALDTLNELAAALGDDANFGATVTNALAALPATYVPLTDVTVRPTVRDAFQRADGGVNGTAADSGQTYRVIPDARILDGRLAAPAAGGASYVRLNLGAPMRAMTGKFIYRPGAAGAATGIALINTADGTTDFLLGNNWLHLAVYATGWNFASITRSGDALIFNTIANEDYATPLDKDAATVYAASMEVRGTQVHVTIWNDTTGQIIVNRTLDDPNVASMLGSYCMWEPINGGVGFDAAEFEAITATTTVSQLDDGSPTRGELTGIVDTRLADPLNLGYATNLPPFAPLSAFGVAAAGYGLVSRLLADSVPDAQHIDFFVAVSSGNLCVGVYRRSIGGVLTRLATSGSFACPAAGAAHIALDVPVSARRETDFLALSADNTSAAVYGAAGALLILSPGGNGVGLLAGMPLPAGPVGAAWYASGPVHHMLLVA